MYIGWDERDCAHYRKIEGKGLGHPYIQFVNSC